jgi:hypothetical protein
MSAEHDETKRNGLLGLVDGSQRGEDDTTFRA